MAEITIDLSKTGSEDITYKASEGVPVRFSDAFLVGGTGEVFMLSFYQQEIPTFQGMVRDQRTDKPEATCFARIVVTPVGFVRLLSSMAERVGLTLTKKPSDSEKEKQQ